MDFNIKIKEGVGPLQLGMTPELVKATLDSPATVSSIDNAFGEPSTLIQCESLGLNLFFEGTDERLTCIEVENEAASLWNESIFDLNEQQVIALMATHGYTDLEQEEEAWGERRVSFGDANLDLFFADDTLISISLGA